MKTAKSITGLLIISGTTWLNAQIHPGTNNVVLGQNSSIAGGDFNKINAVHGIISSGANNTNTANFGSIGGGRYNHVLTEFSTIPGGYWAKTRCVGQMAYASGKFSDPGDAQFGLYVLRGTVSGVGTNALSLDGGTNQITVPANGSFLLDIDVASRSTSPSNSVYGNFFHCRMAVENQNGDLVCQAVDSSSVTNHNPSLIALYSCDTDKFILSGTGEYGNTVYWVATVRATELVKP